MKLFQATLALAVASSVTGQKINEFEPNPTGNDPGTAQVEFKGTPGASFSGCFVNVECDSDGGFGGPSTVNSGDAVSGTFDANGLLVVSIPNPENPSHILALTTAACPAKDSDSANIAGIVDAIGVVDNTSDNCDPAANGMGNFPAFAFTGDEPRLIFRDGVTNDWYAINDPDNGKVLDINDVEVTDTFFGDPFSSTFASVNPSIVDPNDPGGFGDPHLKSWTGEWFEYMGECDLNMIHAPAFDGQNDLDVHIRTTIRFDYSFIESAALRIGKDTLEVSSFGEYAVNGVTDAIIEGGEPTNLRKGAVVSSVGGYPIYHTQLSKKRNTFDIVLGPGENITISTHKDIVAVKVTGAHPDHFAGVTGLLGNFQGKLLARDGATEFLLEDVSGMGQEWQVRSEEPQLFRSARAPQYPQQCRLPISTAEKEARRLGEGITEETAKVACAHAHLSGAAFEACVYDVTAMNDLDQADSGAY